MALILAALSPALPETVFGQEDEDRIQRGGYSW